MAKSNSAMVASVRYLPHRELAFYTFASHLTLSSPWFPVGLEINAFGRLLVSGGRRSLRTTFLPVSAGNARPATASDGATPSLRSFTEIQKLLLLLKPPRNAGRGSSIAADESKKDLSLENVQTSVVSRDDENINVSLRTLLRQVFKPADTELNLVLFLCGRARQIVCRYECRCLERRRRRCLTRPW
jgi:hypothetical protein